MWSQGAPASSDLRPFDFDSIKTRLPESIHTPSVLRLALARFTSAWGHLGMFSLLRAASAGSGGAKFVDDKL